LKLSDHIESPLTFEGGTAGARQLAVGGNLKISEWVRVHGNDLKVSIQLIIKAIGSEGSVKSAVARKSIVAVERGWYSFRSLEGYGWGDRIISPLTPEGGTAGARLPTVSNLEWLKMMLQMELAEKEVLENRNKEAELGVLWGKYYVSEDVVWFLGKLADSVADGLGKKCRDLAMGKAVMLFLAHNTTKVACKKIGYKSFDALLQAVGNELGRLRIYGMPESYHGIKKKYYNSPFTNYYNPTPNPSPKGGESSARKQGLEFSGDLEELRNWMIPGTFGNDNREIMNETHKALIRDFYAKSNKLDKLTVYERYVEEMPKVGVDSVVGYSTVKKYLNKNEVMLEIAGERHGKAWFENNIRPFGHRKITPHSLTMVAGDGWQAGRSVIYKVKNFRGEWVDTRGTMNTWFWYDWKTGAILSHLIYPSENSHQIRHSMRHLVSFWKKVPRAAMIDKKWMKNVETVRLFERIGCEIQEKKAYNPKENKAERYNKGVNKFHRMLDEHWANMTPGYSDDNRHNPEHTRGAKAMPLAEFEQMIMQIIHLVNHTRKESLGGRTPMEVFESSIDPDCHSIDALTMSYAFDDYRIETVRNGVIAIKINAVKYEYMIEDWNGFMAHNIVGNRVRVYYDEKFMESVRVFAFEDEKNADNDRYICEAITLERFEGIKVAQTNADKNIMGLHARWGKGVDDFVEDKRALRKKLLLDAQLDTASVHAVSQDRYKEAQSQSMAMAYESYMEVQEEYGSPLAPEGGTAGTRKTTPSPSPTEKGGLTQAFDNDKYEREMAKKERYKDYKFED
jgi:hypothetical protein